MMIVYLPRGRSRYFIILFIICFFLLRIEKQNKKLQMQSKLRHLKYLVQNKESYKELTYQQRTIYLYILFSMQVSSKPMFRAPDPSLISDKTLQLVLLNVILFDLIMQIYFFSGKIILYTTNICGSSLASPSFCRMYFV